jgi:hypothetical protein
MQWDGANKRDCLAPPPNASSDMLKADSKRDGDGNQVPRPASFGSPYSCLISHLRCIPSLSSPDMVGARTGIIVGVTLCLLPTLCSIAYVVLSQRRKRCQRSMKASASYPDPNMERENVRLKRQRAMRESLQSQLEDDGTRTRSQLETDVEATVHQTPAMPPTGREME